MPCVPMTWPVGQGKTFGGIVNLRTQAMTVFESGSERRPQDFETVPLTDPSSLKARFGHDWETAMESIELATGASPAFDRGPPRRQATPVFFGCRREQLRGHGGAGRAGGSGAVARPARKSSLVVNKQPVEKTVSPDDEGFSGVVFKVQANMDANHRDRIAFVRVASGNCTPGMELRGAALCQGAAADLGRPPACRSAVRPSRRPTPVTSSVFTTHGGVQLGDTITDGATCSSPACPFLAPELFMTVILKNPLRTEQLQTGLEQLGEEGAIQVLTRSRRPHAAGRGGPAEFEVVQHRLKSEYDCDVRLEGCQYTGARWITADTPAELRGVHQRLPATPGAGPTANTLAYLCTSPSTCVAQSASRRSISTRFGSTPGWRWAARPELHHACVERTPPHRGCRHAHGVQRHRRHADHRWPVNLRGAGHLAPRRPARHPHHGAPQRGGAARIARMWPVDAVIGENGAFTGTIRSNASSSAAICWTRWPARPIPNGSRPCATPSCARCLACRGV